MGKEIVVYDSTYMKLLLDTWHLEPLRPSKVKKPAPKPAVFIPGRAVGDDTPLLHEARELLRSEIVQRIVIPGTDGTREGASPLGKLIPTGYLGYQRWRKVLIGRGANPDRILRTRGVGYHTRGEIDDFVILAKEKQWEESYILCHAHQMLRVMLSVLKSRDLYEWPMAIHPLTLSETDWTVRVYGSQGEKKMPRAFHINEELQRVVEYQRKGDLASFDELGRYYRDELGVPWPRWEALQSQ